TGCGGGWAPARRPPADHARRLLRPVSGDAFSEHRRSLPGLAPRMRDSAGGIRDRSQARRAAVSTLPSAAPPAAAAPARGKRRTRGWRWALLLVFVACSAPGLSPLPLYPSVIWLNAVSMAACAVLLWQLRRPARQVLWAWMILVVFILGYYVKTL